MYLKIRMHDCSHKFTDDTKTCVQLFFRPWCGEEMCVAYVFTDQTQDEVLVNKDEYMTVLLETIKDNAEWER